VVSSHTHTVSVCADNCFSSSYSLYKALITHSLGAFTNLWKVTVGFVMSVCVHPCFRLSTWINSAPTRWIFMKFDGPVVLKNDEENWSVIKIWITGALHEDQYTFLITSRTVLRMRNISDKSCRVNQNTHFIFTNFYSKIIPFLK